MRLQLHELHHNLGFLLHQQGDFSGAIENYRQALAHCPTYASSHYALGVILAEQQQYPASIAHYQQAITLDPNYGQAYNNLGCILLLQGHTEQAIQMFQAGIEQQPDLAELQNNLGQALFDRDREAAIGAFRRAVELQPDFTLAHRNLGKLLQQYGCSVDALQAFQNALAINPAQPEVWSDCVVNWLSLGQIHEALTGFRWLIEANQAQVDAYCQRALQLTDADLTDAETDDLAQASIAAAKFLQAIQRVNCIKTSAASARSGFSSEVVQYLSRSYLYLGSALVAYGGKPQYERAEAYFQKAIRLQPQNLQPYLKLAKCLTRQKRFTAALLICDAAEFITPDAPQIERQRSLIERQMKNSTQISDPIKPGIERNRSDLLAVTGIESVQEWLDRQPPSAPDSTAGTASHRFISPADSASLLTSQPFSLSSPLPSIEHSPCEGLNCPTCLKQITDAFEPHYLSHSIAHLHGQGYPTSHMPRFTVRIPGGRVWAVPQQNSWLVCNAIAVLSPAQSLISDLSRSYPIELPCSSPFDPERHHIFSQTTLPLIEQISGQVAVLAGLSGHNYFHWMVDVLPRFEILRQSGINLAEIDWFYLNEPRAPFQQATLKKLGIPLDRVLSSDQHPHIQAEQLIVPSFTGHFGWLEPWMLRFLRQEFLPLASVNSPIGDRFPERLYISRASANHRQVLNDAAVLETLQESGFVAVELERFSFADQIALFTNAKAIVAPHGGGLTNLMFCRPGTTLLEFFSPHYVRHYYWVMGQALGLTHYCLMSEPIKGYPLRELMYASPLIEDLWIDLDVLRAGLKHLDIR